MNLISRIILKCKGDLPASYNISREKWLKLTNSQSLVKVSIAVIPDGFFLKDFSERALYWLEVSLTIFAFSSLCPEFISSLAVNAYASGTVLINLKHHEGLIKTNVNYCFPTMPKSEKPITNSHS